MFKMQKMLILASVLLISACANCDLCNWRTQPKPKIIDCPKPCAFVNDASLITLQNLNNRVVVRCYDNEDNTAESCAQMFEKKGYVRLRDIPYKTANYDFLKVDTYPTRRWRDNEITSRW